MASPTYERRLPLKLASEPAIERKASSANAPIRANTTMAHLHERKGKGRCHAAMQPQYKCHGFKELQILGDLRSVDRKRQVSAPNDSRSDRVIRET